MRILSYLIIILFLSCSAHIEKQDESIELAPAKEVESKLSEVIAPLQDDAVEGYVLIYGTSLEYGSLEKARKDTSPSKAIARIESKRFHLCTPVIKDDPRYNWGSPMICRKVIADHGDVVEVNTLDDAYEVPEKLGHGGLGADYMYDLITFVRKADLVPVIAKPCNYTFDDNTQIHFNPGVAVGIPWNGDETKRVLSVQQMHFEFTVPDSLLALSYQPQLHSLKNTKGKLMLDEKANLFLDGKRFCPVSEIRNIRLRTPVTSKKKGDKLEVVLVANGIKMTLQSDHDLVESYMPNIDRVIMTPAFETPPRWYYRVKEGTPIYWDDGRRAGSVRQFYGYQSEVAPEDGTWCDYMRELFKNERLCFHTKDIEVIDNLKN